MRRPSRKRESPAGPTDRARVVNAWCLYDWANSAFATTILAAMFPPFYRSLAGAAGFSEVGATAAWAYTAAVALFLTAVLSPILGAVADHIGKRKPFLAFFAGLGILFTALFVFLGDGLWLLASLLFIVAHIGFGGANVFYDSLLPSVAKGDSMDRVSARGYALGYVGGGVLLVLNLLWYTHPQWFHLPSQGFAVRLSFFSVAVWWFFFSIPLFRRVPEPPSPLVGEGRGEGGSSQQHSSGSPHNDAPSPFVGEGRGEGREEGDSQQQFNSSVSLVRASFSRLASTFRDLRHYRSLALFLLAFWLYNDGIGTIIKLATAYGSEIGIGVSDMILALVITQFVGIPFAFLFGSLAAKYGTRKMISAGLVVYIFICVGGFMMRHAWQFYALAFAVGTVQGGTQALSRSLFGSMVPEHKTSEFFGFFSTSAKIAGIFGPVFFAVIAQLTGNSRNGILAITLFFAAGLALLWMVDIEKGRSVANRS